MVRAVDGVSLRIMPAEILGLVGESGSGKSTLGRALARIDRPTSGKIYFNGEDIAMFRGSDLRAFQRNVQIVFQDPYASLNPRMTVAQIVEEPLRTHDLAGRRERETRVRELLELVGLPKTVAGRFPHAFSGGQRQRVAIARALASEPQFLIADEPVSALDVSVQAQILNLLKDIQQARGLTMLFISHDLAVVRYIADSVAVMYLGKIVESGSRDAILERPAHPYSDALLSMVPLPDPRRERARSRTLLVGEIPSPTNPPSGCRFRTRCPIAVDPDCHSEPLLRITADRQSVACHFPLSSQPRDDRALDEAAAG